MSRRRVAAQSAQPNGAVLDNIVLVLPLVIFYELGALVTGELNGVDLVTVRLLHWLGTRWFVIAQAGLLALLLGTSIVLRRRQRSAWDRLLPVVLESGVYALTLGTLIVFVLVEVFGLRPQLAAAAGGQVSRGWLATLVVSAGAGVHEELLFRLVGVSLPALLLGRVFGMRRWIAVGGSMILSSLCFALAHHLGLHGEPISWWALSYRFCAGMVFAVLFWWRGFATAVYTHALYDVYVLFLV